ncbi:MAG: nucleoside-diphosphate kinase [Candidatus Hydrothermae bacterium]|nr:nucleoside-diphosphate kinase [Candidatus Hydrothermae bacterium]
MMERTLLMIKPDAVRAGHIGEILTALERESHWHIRGIRMKCFSRDEAESFYAVHRERPFFPDLVTFILSGPVVGILLEGDGVIARIREWIGATDPAKAAPGTIRARFGSNIQENAVHASDSPESAQREIPFFFGEEEVHPCG